MPATYFGISSSPQIVQRRPNPRLAEGDQSNDDNLEQTRPVEPGHILEGHGREIRVANPDCPGRSRSYYSTLQSTSGLVIIATC